MADPVRPLLCCSVSTRRPGKIPSCHRAAPGSTVVFHGCRKDTEFRIGRVRRSNQLRRKEAAFLTAEELARLYYRGDGIVGFEIVGHKDIVTMLGSFDLGLNNDIGPHLCISGGDRVVVASGVALADNQIPHVLAAANEFFDVKTNGDLIAQGAFGGLSFHR